MEVKRKPNCDVLNSSEERPHILSIDLSSRSPATSDLFEPEVEVVEVVKKKTRTTFESPSTSDYFDEISERDVYVDSPLNTSELFEEQQFSSENEDIQFETLSQDSDDDIGCVPLEDSDH